MVHCTMITLSALPIPRTPARMKQGARFEVNMARTC